MKLPPAITKNCLAVGFSKKGKPDTSSESKSESNEIAPLLDTLQQFDKSQWEPIDFDWIPWIDSPYLPYSDYFFDNYDQGSHIGLFELQGDFSKQDGFMDAPVSGRNSVKDGGSTSYQMRRPEHSSDFFAISAFLELLCVLLCAFIFPKLPIVKYYRSKAASEGSKTVMGDLAAGGIEKHHNQEIEEDPKHLERLSSKQLLFENIDYVLDVYLIYVLTLSIFPGFLLEDTGSHGLGSCDTSTIFSKTSTSHSPSP